jgi:hypothetical protein
MIKRSPGCWQTDIGATPMTAYLAMAVYQPRSNLIVQVYWPYSPAGTMDCIPFDQSAAPGFGFWLSLTIKRGRFRFARLQMRSALPMRTQLR